jgi:diacylglycerol O-acyltransferase / wax synthase
MVDGVGSVDIGHVLLDADPHPTPRTPSAHPSDASGTNPAEWLPLSLTTRIAGNAIDTALHPRRLLHAGQAAVAMGEMLWEDEVIPAPHSTLNVPIGATRRFASVPLELPQAKEIKQSLGGTLNDVVLAISAGALRRFLRSRGEDPVAPLRAMVPVNTRGDDHGSLGNRVTSLFVEIPVEVADTRKRYMAVRAAATRLKSGTAALGASTLLGIIGAAPPLLHEPISRTLIAPRLFNITITNVPGPQLSLYALGSRLRRILPLVPLFAGHAVGMAIVSYDGELVFGINADHATTPDLDVLEAALHDEFAQLLEIARWPDGQLRAAGNARPGAVSAP